MKYYIKQELVKSERAMVQLCDFFGILKTSDHTTNGCNKTKKIH